MWTSVKSSKDNKSKNLKKELKNYEDGMFNSLSEATDHLIFSISKGLNVNTLTDFQISLLIWKHGDNWRIFY